MPLPLPTGCTARPAVLDDAPAVLALQNAISLAIINKIEETLDDVLEEWRAPGFDLAQSTRVVTHEDGLVYAYAILYEAGQSEICDMDIYLHPDSWPTDTLTEPFLVNWAEQTVRAGIPNLPPENRIALHAWSYAQDTRYNNLLQGSSMACIRHFYRMQIDFTDPPLPASLPPGFTLRTVANGEDWRPVLEVKRDAWRDHWGYIERPFEEEFIQWRHQWESEFREGLWLLAMDGDTIAGICLCRETAFDDEEHGWVRTLAVRRAYRRRGIARALLQQAFYTLYQHGRKRVGLGVDASSPTGATDLYNSVGMVVANRFDLYEKELRPGLSPLIFEADS